jgi:hypothetical protein
MMNLHRDFRKNVPHFQQHGVGGVWEVEMVSG